MPWTLHSGVGLFWLTSQPDASLWKFKDTGSYTSTVFVAKKFVLLVYVGVVTQSDVVLHLVCSHLAFHPHVQVYNFQSDPPTWNRTWCSHAPTPQLAWSHSQLVAKHWNNRVCISSDVVLSYKLIHGDVLIHLCICWWWLLHWGYLMYGECLSAWLPRFSNHELLRLI